MATSQFSVFGTGSGAYVLPPATWAADPVRQSGFPPGLLPKEKLNTPLRQASSIATMLANFIAANQGDDVLDDGDLAALLSQFGTALSAFNSQTATSYSIATANGAAASRNVFLGPGIWQMVLQFSVSKADGGGFDATATQGSSVVGALNSMSANASIHLYRAGGAGFGRNIGFTTLAVNQMTVVAGEVFAMGMAAANLNGLTSEGSRLTLDKIG